MVIAGIPLHTLYQTVSGLVYLYVIVALVIGNVKGETSYVVAVIAFVAYFIMLQI